MTGFKHLSKLKATETPLVARLYHIVQNIRVCLPYMKAVFSTRPTFPVTTHFNPEYVWGIMP